MMHVWEDALTNTLSILYSTYVVSCMLYSVLGTP